MESIPRKSKPTKLCPLVGSGIRLMDHPKDQPLCLVLDSQGIHIISDPDILIGTLPETNSSHLKIGRTCHKETSIPYSNGIHFLVRTVSLSGGYFVKNTLQLWSSHRVPKAHGTLRGWDLRGPKDAWSLPIPSGEPDLPYPKITLPKYMERWSRVSSCIIRL